jgi:hypothetical protein
MGETSRRIVVGFIATNPNILKVYLYITFGKDLTGTLLVFDRITVNSNWGFGGGSAKSRQREK